MKSFKSKYNRAMPAVIEKPKDMMDLTVEEFASMFHTAAIGMYTGKELVKFEAERVRDSGYHFQAFNIESPYLEFAQDILGDTIQYMVPIAYPVGGQTLRKRLSDMEYIVKHQADQCCVSINYTAALSGRYDIVENDCKKMHEEFDHDLHVIDIVPATLFTAKELIEVCKAIQSGGGYHLKVNPGYGLGTTFEEVCLIRRIFKDHFIIDPSGGIRELKDVRRLVNSGFTVIHSQKTFPFIEEFKAMKEKGEIFND